MVGRMLSHPLNVIQVAAVSSLFSILSLVVCIFQFVVFYKRVKFSHTRRLLNEKLVTNAKKKCFYYRNA